MLSLTKVTYWQQGRASLTLKRIIIISNKMPTYFTADGWFGFFFFFFYFFLSLGRTDSTISPGDVEVELGQ